MQHTDARAETPHFAKARQVKVRRNETNYSVQTRRDNTQYAVRFRFGFWHLQFCIAIAGKQLRKHADGALHPLLRQDEGGF